MDPGIDVGVVTASFLLTQLVARRFSVPGPGSWAVLCALAVSTWRLTNAGLTWHDFGLRLPDNTVHAIAWVAVIYAAGVLTNVLIISPLGKAAGWPALNLSRFAKLPGNTGLMLGGLILVWLQAAFGEELVFRGFLLTRFELLFGAGSSSAGMAITAQALLFGAGHWYLGPRGITNAAFLGAVLGIVYLWDGRNLVPLVVAHGLADSVSLMAIYLRLVKI